MPVWHRPEHERVCSSAIDVSRNASANSLSSTSSPHLYVIFTISLIGAAGIATFITWLFLRGSRTALRERLKSREDECARAQVDLQAARQSESELRAQVARLETSLTAERDAHTRLANEFKALSADALSKNTDEFLKLARESFGKLHQQSADELGKRQQAIDTLIKPLAESLQSVNSRIGEIEKARADAYGRLSEQLKSLGTAQNQLQAEAAKLTTALRSTTTAGTWGELQLRRVVELSGMSSYCDFDEQSSVTADERRFRPDVVVRLPGGQRIIIDAKAPNDAYREAVNATDDAVRTEFLNAHAAKVRAHIDALGAKNYWEQFQPSPEFVVLFLPGDQFLSGALQADPTLIDRAIGRKVLLATPATLIALLKAAAYGWRQEAISRNAEEIATYGRQLYDRVAVFTEHFEKVGRNLENATKSYNSAVGSLESSLLPGARRFAELGAKGNKELPEPSAIDTQPREITRRT
ncbi:MAG: DNA recombination protein RmuC [Opitutaceae bacterium]|nr:DNA recombination protein RmuC [Opitutaceae bacterium]